MDLTIQHVDNLTLGGSAEGVEDAIQSLVAQKVSYGTPSIDPESVEYTRDSWDGDGVMSAAPNPSDGEDAQSQLRDMVALYPTEPDDATDNKANYKLPFRESPEGPVNMNAVTAAIGAINGARGGVEAPEDALREAYNLLVQFAVAGGQYEDRDNAPDFTAKAAFDGGDTPFRASVSGASPDGGDDLRGVVWAAGDHTLYLNGDPTPVHVPEDSIPRTFDSVNERIQAGEPPKIGLDHGDSLHEDSVPVASELDVLTIGQATDFDLSDDGSALVMTDYELTKDEAVDAAANGRFANKDYSIVGDLRIHTDDGQPKTVKSGGKERLVVTAETVRQVDVVKTGAVSGAGPGNMPPLQTAASLAAEKPTEPATALTASLRFMAKRTRDSDMNSLNDLEDVDDPNAVLEGAAEVVEHKDEQIQRLRAVASAAGVDVDEDADTDELTERAEAVAERADAAQTLADFHDVDLTAEDGVQALVDEHTADIREDVAAKEATLPKYDTGADDGPSVDDRAEDLKGKSPSELQAMAGQRATEILDSEQARAEYGKAFASGDGADDNVGGSSSGAGDEDAEAVAQSAMTVDEKLEFKNSDHDSAAEFMAERYDEDPADFVNEDNPASAFVAATAEKGDN